MTEMMKAPLSGVAKGAPRIGTTIGWTDETWNPLTWRCTPITEECDRCYAHNKTRRWQGSDAFISEPPAIKPLRLLLPLLSAQYRRGGRMFTTSMSDPFHAGLPVEDIALIWAVMAAAPQWEHQVLTKRHARAFSILSSPEFPALVQASFERVAAMVKGLGKLTPTRRRALAELEQAAASFVYPIPNVLVGMSAGSDKWARRRLPRLVATPAAARFVSVEPCYTAVDLTPWLDQVHWVIIGGESGAGSRRFDPGWARWVVAQCREAGVPVFVKQLGSVWASQMVTGDGRTVRAHRDSKGENTAFWPEDLRIQEFPVLARAAA